LCDLPDHARGLAHKAAAFGARGWAGAVGSGGVRLGNGLRAFLEFLPAAEDRNEQVAVAHAVMELVVVLHHLRLLPQLLIHERMQ
jgi:hypothetical protein